MKFLKVFATLLIFFSIGCFAKYTILPAPVVDEKPLLVVVIMVKNEQPVMEATLKPFFDAGVQHYVVLDTGSTDGTVEYTRQLFKKYNVAHGYVVEKPFVNFATSRNQALESTEHIFPAAAFILMIDAEWYVHNVKGLLDVCEKYKSCGPVNFSINRKIKKSGKESKAGVRDYCNWLFRPNCGIRFSGVVHEVINQGRGTMLPDDILIEYSPSVDGRKRSEDRWLRDCKLLEQECKNNPSNLRNAYYLGQTYLGLKDFNKALFWYGKRCTKTRYDEENFLAHYRIGFIYEMLNDWDNAFFYYCLAHEVRPQRVESIVKVAQHYVDKKEYVPAFLVSKYAFKFPFPLEEMLMLEGHAYDSIRYDILAKSAWHLGEYEIGQQAVMRQLQHEPNNQRLLNNAVKFDVALNHGHCNDLDRSRWCDWCNGKLWLSRAPWLNICCLSNASYRSNRCNTSNYCAWRNWF